MNVSPNPTRMCWICGKVVDLLTSTTDEHGNSVHGPCYAARTALLASTQARENKMPKPASIVTSDDGTPELTCTEWQMLYLAALLEVDLSRKKQKILDAETAIFKRRAYLRRLLVLIEVFQQNGAVSQSELKKITDALSCLNMLRDELERASNE